MRRTATALALLATLALAACGDDDSDQSEAGADEGQMILATTTSTQDSGLLDELVPQFQDESGCSVKTVAVGSGEALELGEKGNADVLLVHSPEAEQEYMDGGHGVSRRAVMHNDFIVVGPKDDPAWIKGAGSAAEIPASGEGEQPSANEVRGEMLTRDRRLVVLPPLPDAAHHRQQNVTERALDAERRKRAVERRLSGDVVQRVEGGGQLVREPLRRCDAARLRLVEREPRRL